MEIYSYDFNSTIESATMVKNCFEFKFLQFSVKTVVSLPCVANTADFGTLRAEADGPILEDAEQGATLLQAEDGKQLVSIGDGQYVELPEGYTLIQTDEGYVIGQPGATFVQVDLRFIQN